MIILAQGSTQHILRYGPAHLGGLIVPSWGSNASLYLGMGAKWAMDNGCFHQLDEKAYLRMLERNKQYASSCLWVTVPDVVGDATATLSQFKYWQPIVKSYGYKCAFVAQNGLENMLDEIPWNDFDCLFIGGSTEWKLGEAAIEIAAMAKSRGKWVHVGRVNSQRRLYHSAIKLQADSVDGQAFSKFGNRDLKWGLSQCTFYSLAYPPIEKVS